MKYLIRKASKSRGHRVAHLWDGTDTLCKLWSTGGIKKGAKYEIVGGTSPGLPVCHMCQTVESRRNYPLADGDLRERPLPASSGNNHRNLAGGQS